MAWSVFARNKILFVLLSNANGKREEEEIKTLITRIYEIHLDDLKCDANTSAIYDEKIEKRFAEDEVKMRLLEDSINFQLSTFFWRICAD